MPTDEEIIKQMTRIGTDEIPEHTGTSNSLIYRVLQQNEGKWINATMLRERMEQIGAPSKNLGMKLNNLKKKEGIQVEKRGGRNFYRYVSNQ